jgi:hypothetical protein
MTAILSGRRVACQGRWGREDERQKIKLRHLSYFSARKSVRPQTTFATQFTTTSPQKHHVLHTVFRKTPAKTHIQRRQKIHQNFASTTRKTGYLKHEFFEAKQQKGRDCSRPFVVD